MADTEFGTNDAQTVKRWGTSLFRETISEMYCSRFMGRGKNSPITLLTDLEDKAGDQVKYDLRVLNRTSGVEGDAEIEGFEDELTFYQDTINIDQLRKAHSFRRMTQQRTVHDLRTEARESLKDWWARQWDIALFSYAAGTVGDDALEPAVNIPFASNTLAAPDAAHLVDDGGTPIAMTTELIDRCVEVAKTVNPKVRPVMIDGAPHYCLVLHPYAVYSLRNDTASANTWITNQQNANIRGSKNPIFTGALGIHNGVILYESEYIRRTGANCHNIFFGAQAMTMAFGNAYPKSDLKKMEGGAMFSWNEQTRDYGNKKGIAGGAVMGIKRATFNSAAHGLIRLDTADASHNT